MHKTQSVFDEYNLFSKAVNWTAIKAAMKEKSRGELHTNSTTDRLQIITGLGCQHYQGIGCN